MPIPGVVCWNLAHDRVSNPVVLTGDVHANWACDLLADFDHPTSTVVGTEFVGTSISSGGDGSDFRRSARRILDHNPHIHFHNNHRGYVRCRLTPQYWQTDYRVVPYVSRPGAPILTRASFVVENGRPGISQISEISVPTYKGDR
ncbi:phosphodiesterase/alkaline phosphatase D [Desmospora sp. 8437]|nr:phosphodiesterase/alkaline phosphatase D [Desmospora sp. 8437]